MTDHPAQRPAADEPIRSISRGSTSRSIPKRKDRVLSTPQVKTVETADDTRSKIEQLAYALYQQRGQRDGHDCEDWLEAERMVKTASAAQSPEGPGRSGSHALHSA